MSGGHVPSPSCDADASSGWSDYGGAIEALKSGCLPVQQALELAKDPRAPLDLLRRLADSDDGSCTVLRAVASNPACDSKLLREILRQTKNPEIGPYPRINTEVSVVYNPSADMALLRHIGAHEHVRLGALALRYRDDLASDIIDVIAKRLDDFGGGVGPAAAGAPPYDTDLWIAEHPNSSRRLLEAIALPGDSRAARIARLRLSETSALPSRRRAEANQKASSTSHQDAVSLNGAAASAPQPGVPAVLGWLKAAAQALRHRRLADADAADLASNSSVPPELLSQLAERGNPDVLCALACNRACCPELVRTVLDKAHGKLSEEQWDTIGERLLWNQSGRTAALRQHIAENGDPRLVYWLVLRCDDLPSRHVDTAARRLIDGDPAQRQSGHRGPGDAFDSNRLSVSEVIASHPNAPVSWLTLIALGDDGDAARIAGDALGRITNER